MVENFSELCRGFARPIQLQIGLAAQVQRPELGGGFVVAGICNKSMAAPAFPPSDSVAARMTGSQSELIKCLWGTP